jgi:hypothetical protein
MHFSTDTLFQPSAPSIDTENGIIKNVLVVSKGEAKGHNLFLNDEFLERTALLGNEPAKGIKARYGHPNMCSTALGTYIGRYKNFHKENSNVLADLYLDETARISPNGNLYDYILSLAATNPDMFGSSIAFKCGEVKTITEEIENSSKTTTRNFASIESLHAVDLVDDPAATDGLFAQFHQNDWAFTATLFLNQNPSLLNLLANNPYVFTEFITKYLTNNNMPIPEEFKKFKEKISDFFQKNNITPPERSLSVNAEETTATRSSSEVVMSEVEARSSSEVEMRSSSEVEMKDKLIEELQSNLSESISLAEQLQSQVELLSANKTVPPNIADPKLNINKSTDEDTAGKQLLKEIPYQDRQKLKLNQQL